MSPSSSRSDADPFAFLVADTEVDEVTSATAWLRAMLDVEAALALAQADTGEIPHAAGAAIADACSSGEYDVGDVFDAAAPGGNPAIPLVDAIRRRVGAELAAHVHHGATSQDVVDTAAMLVIGRTGAIVVERLVALTATVESLRARHGTTPMIGRTLLQHARATTFGSLASSWVSGLRAAADAIGAPPRPVQLGGPVGDRVTFGPRSGEIADDVAHRLGLDRSPLAWHGDRTPITRHAVAWGVAAAAVSKVATDIVLLSGSDVGEVHELAEDSGGSSSMEHKRNPIAAVSARAAAMQVPGLVATVLTAAGQHELQRAAGPWHAEWPAIRSLLRATAAAAGWLATSLASVTVDEVRMATNLAGAGIPDEDD